MALFDRISDLFSGGKLNVRHRFELLRKAISGTMSKFYMARDRKTGQIVGLKILDREKTAAFMARFKGLDKPSEGEIAVQLEHPRIVKTFEHGLTTEGEQYLVMEFLEGAGMNSLLIARDEVLEGRRVEFIRQLAEAIAFVHEKGFLHRDICPRNLILAGDGESLKLIDFGLTVPATKPFMAPGNRTGTPNYMAPELVRRYATDHRLDVFSFGVTAYEMCTFELPWVRGVDGMAAMTHNQPPTDIRKYCPRIDPVLARAIHSCIEPEPNRRCASMQDFLQVIRGVTTFETS
ncbi:MAG: serine/threonine protein kinase [Pirellulaceae bacterium]|nr:serine/threonine protein kinase [Pirellulaceae bacterium]